MRFANRREEPATLLAECAKAPCTAMRGEIRTQQEILRKRRGLYTRAQPAIDPAGRAAIGSVRARKPCRLLVAIGVAPPETLERIRSEADEVVCLYSPPDFYAVGQFFEAFSEVTDEMVVAPLSTKKGVTHV